TVDLTKKLRTAANDSLTPYEFQFTIASLSGPATFLGNKSYPVGDQPYYVVVGDLDNDGDNDIVAANRLACTISVLKNYGDGTFATKTDYATRAQPQSIALADIDHDGYTDIIVANTGSFFVS